MRRSNQRGMAISLFVIIISIFNFERLTDSDCIRTIHVVTLLICGMAIGIFLMNLFSWLRTRKN